MSTDILVPTKPAKTGQLAVVVRLQSEGPEVLRVPVTDADLLGPQTEAWHLNVLRRRQPDVPLEALQMDLIPLLKKEERNKCLGYAIEFTPPGGEEPVRTEFTVSSMQHVAERAARSLQDSSQLKMGESYFYELIWDRRPVTVARTAAEQGSFTITAHHPPLVFLTVPLPPLLAPARRHGEVDDRWPFVLYTEEAFAKTERYARRGAQEQPPVETGAVLIANLCSCPETGEFYTVIVDALEVQDAEQTKFSLEYTNKSWMRIHTILKARQAQPATRAQRLVGQGHGHNFAPLDGAPPCEICHQQAVCTRTSVFVSQDDRDWTRATFPRQAWALCHVFGVNARAELVHSLYGLRDGRLQERGFHIIPEFTHS